LLPIVFSRLASEKVVIEVLVVLGTLLIVAHFGTMIKLNVLLLYQKMPVCIYSDMNCYTA